MPRWRNSTLKAASAIESTKRLLQGEAASNEDVSAFGRANFFAFLSGYEPIFALADQPQLDPDLGDLLPRFSKHFAGLTHVEGE